MRGGWVSRGPVFFVAAEGAPHWLAGMLLGVLAALAAGAARGAFDALLGAQAPFLMQIPSVVLATWLGGLTGGIAATVTSAVVADYFFVEPRYTAALHTSGHAGGAVLFILVSLGLAWQVNRWRAAERALRVTRDRAAEQAGELQALIDAVPAAVLVTRQPDQPPQPANTLATTLLGPPTAEAPGGARLLRFESADGTSTLTPADLPVARAAADGVEVRDAEFSAVYDDGTTRTLFGHAVPLVGGRGGLRGAVGAFVDISERNRAEAVLHQYELLARHTRDMVLFVRRCDGRILEANAAAEAAYGFPRHELLERTIFDLREVDDEPRTREQMAAADGDGVLFETRHRRRDGTSFPVEVSSRGMTIRGERVLLSVVRDITERARAEQSLRESESRMAALLNGVTESIWLFDRDGRVLLANATMAVRLGRAATDVIGLTFADLLPPALAESRRQRFDEVIRTGQPVRFEDERAGLLFDHTFYPVRDVDGTVIGVASFSRDISEQKRIESALVEQAERLQLQAALLENAHDAIIVRDADGRIAFWNRGAEQLYGWAADEALGRNVHDLLSSDAGVLDRARAALATAGEWQGELQQRRKDGSRVVVDSRHATLDGGGAAGPLLEINRDVSDRKQAEEQRADMMARLALLLEVSESLSAAATPDDIVDILLGKAVPALGAHAGVVAALSDDGRDIEILGSRGYSEQARRALRRLPLQSPSPLGEAIRADTTVVVPDPTERQARPSPAAPAQLPTASGAFAAIPLRGSRVRGAIGLSLREPELNSRDRTFAALVARQAAQALERADLLVSERRAHAAAEEASRIKDDFLATLSHELRTPLNAILGWSHMMLAESLPAESQRRAIEVIARNAAAQVRLVDEVLDLSRIVRGQLHLDLRPVDVRAVIHRALDTARPAAAAKGLVLDVRLPEGLVTIADTDRLQQVVWNLLSNAVKFTPAGGRITITATRGPSFLAIDVRDTGIGVPPAFLPHVFERFRQADSSTSRHHGGLGLGLAIVRHIVELHGGTVAAESRGSGTGSCFTITLPLQTAMSEGAMAAPDAEPALAHVSEARALQDVRVLVVDDDADARDVLEAILAGAGARVTLASSAGQALELLPAVAPDLIVSDISMPGEDGYWFIRAVRATQARQSRVPAIAVTAHGHPADRATALAAGFDQHMAKPLTPRDLIAAVATLVRPGEANAEE